MLNIARNLNVGVYFIPVKQANCGDHNLDITEEQASDGDLRKAFLFLMQEKREGNPLIKNSLTGLNYYYNWPEVKKLFCMISLISCFINPEGKVFICDAFPGYDKYLKSVSSDFKSAFNKLKLPHNCAGCWCPSYLDFNLVTNFRFRGILEMGKIFLSQVKRNRFHYH